MLQLSEKITAWMVYTQEMSVLYGMGYQEMCCRPFKPTLSSQKDRGKTCGDGDNQHLYFHLCMPIDIFDFLQSDWLQQRAAFYDILTVVQKCYFFTNRQE